MTQSTALVMSLSIYRKGTSYGQRRQKNREREDISRIVRQDAQASSQGQEQGGRAASAKSRTSGIAGEAKSMTNTSRHNRRPRDETTTDRLSPCPPRRCAGDAGGGCAKNAAGRHVRNEAIKRIEQRVGEWMRELDGIRHALRCGMSVDSDRQVLKRCGTALSRLCMEYVAVGGTQARFVEICHVTAGV